MADATELKSVAIGCVANHGGELPNLNIVPDDSEAEIELPVPTLARRHRDRTVSQAASTKQSLHAARLVRRVAHGWLRR